MFLDTSILTIYTGTYVGVAWSRRPLTPQNLNV